MINKRLLSLIGDSKKYIVGNVVFQWINLLASISTILVVANLLEDVTNQLHGGPAVKWTQAAITIAVVAVAIIVRGACNYMASRMSYMSSKEVKETLRNLIFKKMLKIGNGYSQKVATSEIIQVSVEGVEQLETYFGAYLPQFFYALIAPITLFFVIVPISFRAAIVLLICVPLIPISIIAISKFAKKLLSKYWGKYTNLGDTFLENLQGLTTLKIYKADEYKNQKMNEDAEAFRVVTMKVLEMQLNSIIVMDLVAYGGAAVGIAITVIELAKGHIDVSGAIAITLLAADYFIPMRLLGSFFHIAMNGIAAGDKIFKLLDMELPEEPEGQFPEVGDFEMYRVTFSYDGEKDILSEVDAKFPRKQVTAIVGESGSGKSTMASILTKRNQGYIGKITVDGMDFERFNEKSLMENVTYIGHNSYLFKGTVRENLLMGSETAKDEQLWSVLERVNLADFFKSENGLDTKLDEAAKNLSGGQRQRLALGRALLHDTDFYIFDEATSNVDVESEETIMEEIYRVGKEKGVIVISHRLANVAAADNILVLDKGKITEEGRHEQLLEKEGTYSRLWNQQYQLENFGREGI